MHVVGGHYVKARPDGQGEAGQGVVAGAVERPAVIPQLDCDVGRTEPVDQPPQCPLGHRRPLTLQRPGHQPLAAAGENQPVAGFGVGDPAVEIGQDHAGCPLGPGQLGFADDSGQGGVADGVAGQDEEMGAVGVGLAG